VYKRQASQFPHCHVTGVSNSRTQKEYIDGEAVRRGLTNVTILTADMNDFVAPGTFDRIVSVEMFEHLRNYEAFLARVASWMKPDALLFVHIFCHARYAYPFEMTGDDDWMARYFFTGGIMPSADLLSRFDRDVKQIAQWTVDGTHYERTCNAWLAQMDRQRGDLMPMLASTYGKENALTWWVYWRVFFMSCAELFGFRRGHEWLVAHYLFDRR
jgi:cyclopropane-fatty-acyl-phospholipid synthase